MIKRLPGIIRLLRIRFRRDNIALILIIIALPVLAAIIGFATVRVWDFISAGAQPGLNETERAFSVRFDSTAQYLDRFAGDISTVSRSSAESVRAGLGRFYDKSTFTPVWFDGVRLSEHAIALIRDICRADQAALLPADYQPALLREALDRATSDPTAEALAALDIALSRAFMLFADENLAGRTDPQTLPYDVFLRRENIALDSVLEATLARGAPESFFEEMKPHHPHFQRLVEARNRYTAITEQGGWPTVETQEPLERGMTHPAVIALRKRLGLTDDLPESEDTESPLYDDEVAAGVAHFQARHGIKIDSVAGPQTLEALNVGVDERIEQIERNMERWRWLPGDLSDRYVLVNIPAFKVYGYDGGEEVLDMRVIVGSEYEEHFTPIFRDRMEFVVFKPYWNVPENIVIEEIAPRAMEDRSFLDRNNYEVLDEDEVVRVKKGTIKRLLEGEYKVRQKGGPNNALGLVKFIFPNQHAVYLHDSPADHLFDLEKRDLSHGCIRLEDPEAFAHYVLGRQGWSPAEIAEVMQTDERQEVRLEEPIPVYLMYLTAFVDDEGAVFFFDDVYAYDRQFKALNDARERRLQPAIEETNTVCQSLERFQKKLS